MYKPLSDEEYAWFCEFYRGADKIVGMQFIDSFREQAIHAVLLRVFCDWTIWKNDLKNGAVIPPDFAFTISTFGYRQV